MTAMIDIAAVQLPKTFPEHNNCMQGTRNMIMI